MATNSSLKLESAESLFALHKAKVFEAVEQATNELFINDSYYKNYVYPQHILRDILSYFIFDRDTYWSTSQKQVKFLSNDNRSIIVPTFDTFEDNIFVTAPILSEYNLHYARVGLADRDVYAIIAGMEVGTAIICNDNYNYNYSDIKKKDDDNDDDDDCNYNYNELLINEFNESYIFEFKYSKGDNMDVIIGIVDSNFLLNDNYNIKANGVANDDNSFNYGLRYDNTICFNNDYYNWGSKKDKHNTNIFQQYAIMNENEHENKDENGKERDKEKEKEKQKTTESEKETEKETDTLEKRRQHGMSEQDYKKDNTSTNADNDENLKKQEEKNGDAYDNDNDDDNGTGNVNSNIVDVKDLVKNILQSLITTGNGAVNWAMEPISNATFLEYQDDIDHDIDHDIDSDDIDFNIIDGDGDGNVSNEDSSSDSETTITYKTVDENGNENGGSSTTRWNNGDIITMKIDTMIDSIDINHKYNCRDMIKYETSKNVKLGITFWVNDKKIFCDENIMSRQLYGKIQFPLRVAASCARDGGVEILRVVKLA